MGGEFIDGMMDVAMMGSIIVTKSMVGEYSIGLMELDTKELGLMERDMETLNIT